MRFIGNDRDRKNLDVIVRMHKRIETGTPEGDALGFSERLFSGWLEMREKNHLYLHYIISREKNTGNTQNLIRGWLEEGYDVSVVMPRPIMQHILRKFRFIPAYEYLPDQYEGSVEVWHSPEMPSSYFSSGTAVGIEYGLS